MPDWIGGAADVNVRNRRSVSYKLQHTGGYVMNVAFGNGLLGDANYTVNEVSALRASLGQMSNFGIRYQNESLRNEVAVQFVRAIDDAYGPGIALNLTFQNNDQDSFTVSIPGPLKELFNGESATPVDPDIAADPGTGERILAEVVRDIENLVNNSFLPANSYTYIGGQRTERDMTKQTRPDRIQLIESTVDSVPSS